MLGRQVTMGAVASALVLGTAAAQRAVRPATPRGSLPVFPGVQGFGTTTPAGRGGTVLRVTTLSDSGAGSLRAALEATGPRVIVFEVGGTIVLRTNLTVSNPYLTVAGQSAPSPGITLRGATLIVRTHDVLLQHLRVRAGDDPDGPPARVRDAISLFGPGTHDVVIDHVSASWGLDEVLGTWSPLRDVTIRYCILSEGLRSPLYPTGPHSAGVLLGEESVNLALIGNLLAHNVDRNPAIKSDVSALVVNNVIYNWGNGAAMHVWRDADKARKPTLASIVGNVFIAGTNTPKRAYPVRLHNSLAPGSRVYVADNLWHAGTADPWSLVELRGRFAYDPKASQPPVWVSPLTVYPSSAVVTQVLARAGARPADRDAVDARTVHDVRTRRGRTIATPGEVGGWPPVTERRRALTLPADPSGDADGDGYTNVEEWLHQLAAEVERLPGR